jgi:hypothetical protein
MFAQEKGLEMSTVTEAMVAGDSLGVEHYACIGLKFNARSAYNQTLQRGLKKESPKMKELFTLLIEPHRSSFMGSFCMHKNFNVVEESREHIISTKNNRLQKGRFLTLNQIAMKLGGWDNPEAKRQTLHYKAMCESEGLKARM